MTVQTHIIIRELEGKGASPELAAGVVEAIAQMQTAGDVTKGDLLAMEKRLAERFDKIERTTDKTFTAISVDMEWLKKAIIGLYGFVGAGLLGAVAFLLQHYAFK